jgi:hypothetical protein
MAVLPYMKQLAKDYYANNYPTSVSTTTPSPPTTVAPTPPTPPYSQSGGVWYGTSPPPDPGTGWLWMDTDSNGLFIFTAAGVWEQVGTNW